MCEEVCSGPTITGCTRVCNLAYCTSLLGKKPSFKLIIQKGYSLMVWTPCTML